MNIRHGSLCYQRDRLCLSNDSGQITQGLLSPDLRRASIPRNLSMSERTHSRYKSYPTERGMALRVPSDHLSPELGKEKQAPRAKATAPQSIQWLAWISYRCPLLSISDWEYRRLSEWRKNSEPLGFLRVLMTDQEKILAVTIPRFWQKA